MKLIVERDENGDIHCYREQEKHFKRVEKDRATESTKLDPKLLDNGCNLHMAMGNSTYFVFDVKK